MVTAAVAAAVAMDGNNLPGTSTAVSGCSSNNDSRRGRTQTGKRREPVQQWRQVRADADGQGTRAGAGENNNDFTVGIIAK